MLTAKGRVFKMGVFDREECDSWIAAFKKVKKAKYKKKKRFFIVTNYNIKAVNAKREEDKPQINDPQVKLQRCFFFFFLNISSFLVQLGGLLDGLKAGLFGDEEDDNPYRFFF